jgi:hypothetical protein
VSIVETVQLLKCLWILFVLRHTKYETVDLEIHLLRIVIREGGL